VRIRDAFDRCRARQELALIPYLTGGFPSLSVFAEHLRAVAASGADLIEIGIPFSDPIADGPTIQYSSQVALRGGATLPALFEVLRSVQIVQPLIFMSYLNPLLAFGQDRLLAEMQRVGVCGLIIPDLPAEEAGEWQAASAAAKIDLIFLAAPTSPDARLREIAARSNGFIYAVSRSGVTGAKSDLHSGLGEFVGRIRALTQMPIAVGFGISRPEHIRALRGLADGAVVGSRLVDAIRNGEDVGTLLRELKEATK
jgi:tryptophan synthase alpha chain